MTKAQAVSMNRRFTSMDSTIKAYEQAYKFKYNQYHQASKELARKDSIVGELNRELQAKPAYKEVTKVDILAGSFFVGFSVLMAFIVL